MQCIAARQSALALVRSTLARDPSRCNLIVHLGGTKQIRHLSLHTRNLLKPTLNQRSKYLLSANVNGFSLNSARFVSEEVKSNPDNVIDLTNNSELSSASLENVFQSLAQPVTELSVASLNLGSNYTPIGWCVHYLDFLHTAFPWWGSIAIGTLILRVCMIPFVISAQRTAAQLNEILPEQAILKEKMNQARVVGDTVEFARLAQESHTLFKRRGVNPLKSFIAPFAQAPVFITFFLTLRRMANYPVESLKTGGILWFTDLSIADPLYILPVLTSATLWLTLEMSFKSGQNPNQSVVFKYGARVIPAVALMFTFNFPSAIMTYWCTNNFISLIQVNLLKRDRVRQFLNIPSIKVNPIQLDVNKKSFKTHFKETMENAKINRLLEERKTVDEITFRKSGIGPLQKTYKQDPTRMKNK